MADRCGVLPSATEQIGQTSVLTLFMAGAHFGECRSKHIKLKGLILAQNERWRRGLGMQVVRESPFGERTAAKGRVTRGYIPSGPG